MFNVKRKQAKTPQTISNPSLLLPFPPSLFSSALLDPLAGLPLSEITDEDTYIERFDQKVQKLFKNEVRK